MIEQAVLQLAAVIVGGLLTITGGFLSTVMLERRRQSVEARSLALSFKGEIGALVTHIQTRGYVQRMRQVIDQIEATREPFFMPFRVHFEYDRVYDGNVEKIGMLAGDLPEMIPRFYTQLMSVMDDMVNLGERTYERLDLPVLLRVYRDMLRFTEETVHLGEQLLAEIDRLYAAEGAS